MSRLAPLETLYESGLGDVVQLPEPLATLYGELRFGGRQPGPSVIANFASTLDGVVALGGPGRTGGGEITGFDLHDRMGMGVLRAVADAVIVGAGTLRSVPHHLWTAPHVFPLFAEAYGELRRERGQPASPWNVVVTARGKLDLSLPVFRSGEVPVLVVTTAECASRLRSRGLPPAVRVAGVRASGRLRARAVLREVQKVVQGRVLLIEGGPHLLADFFNEGCLDDLFLTLSPQVAGRGDSANRLGLVMGREFAPARPIWGSLNGLKRGGDQLFLRFGFPRTNAAAAGVPTS